jgi:hypothetical protein
MRQRGKRRAGNGESLKSRSSGLEKKCAFITLLQLTRMTLLRQLTRATLLQ